MHKGKAAGHRGGSGVVPRSVVCVAHTSGSGCGTCAAQNHGDAVSAQGTALPLVLFPNHQAQVSMGSGLPSGGLRRIQLRRRTRWKRIARRG